MIATDEDALICDFAETYHIFNIYEFPVEYVAILAFGLREDSRIKMAMAGLRVDVKTLLLAHIADNTAINAYFKTKDAQKGRNQPKSMLKVLTQKESEIARGFENEADFIEEWRRINGN